MRLSALLLLASLAVPHAATADPPNVVVIWADDLTATALGCYGLPDSHTPNIDALAARSVVFDRAYCAYPVCGPSRIACMAGMDAESLGMMSNYRGAEKTDAALADRPSMSQAFRAAGYRAMRSGKIYHQRIPGDITAGVAGPDHAASWDQTYNAHAPEWMTDGEATNIGRTKLRMDRDAHYDLGFGGAFYEVRGSGDGSEQADWKIAEAAIAMIEANRERPFYLAVGFVRPHVPLVAPADRFDLYDRETLMLPSVPADEPEAIADVFRGRTSQGFGFGTEAKKRRARHAYFTAASFMDEQVGRVLHAIEANGLADRTIVVFKSDHGWQLGEHDLWQKMSLLEETARIPLMIAAPGVEPRRTAALAQQIDLYPTLCDLAGVETPPHVQGRSLVPVMTGQSDAVHDAVSTVMKTGRLLRTDRYAYLRSHKTGDAALFDMRSDPGQHTNLVGDPKMATVEAKLRERLNRLMDDRGLRHRFD